MGLELLPLLSLHPRGPSNKTMIRNRARMFGKRQSGRGRHSRQAVLPVRLRSLEYLRVSKRGFGDHVIAESERQFGESCFVIPVQLHERADKNLQAPQITD